MLLAHTTHIILLLLAPLILGETTLELTNTQTIIDEQDALTDVTPVSFGIKSFTVEVMKPTTKPTLNTSQLLDDESARIAAAVVEDSTKFDKSQQPNHLSTADNVERFQTTELSPSTEFRDGEATITPTEPVMPPSDLNGKSEITFIEQENTDERPPDSSSSIFSSVTVITSSPTTVDSGGKTEEPMINDIHIERQLENGLYRIKLAEIITDEFNNGAAGANLNPNSDRKERNQLQMKSTGGKINIIDLYPSKLEDFGPMIKESNEKMLKDRDMYLRDNDNDDEKNSLPNSLNGLFEDDSNIPTSKIEIELIDENDNSQRSTDMVAKITDITGKLQQQDGVITEIEKKFRLDELKQSTPKTVTVNHKIDFIDRRVKKSFDYPPTSQFARFGTFGRIDFANTKFNTDSTKRDTNRETEHNDRPEFSTTKFYNSKELYNEMLHKKLTADILGAGDGRIATLSQPLTTIKPNIISVNSANINDNRTSPLMMRDITTEEIQRRDEKNTVIVTSTTLSDSKASHYDGGDVSTTAHTTAKPLKKTKALPRSTTKSIIRASTADTPSTSMVLKAVKATTIPPATLTTNEVAKESTTLKEVPDEKQETMFPEYVNVAGMSTQEQTSPTTVTTSFSKITEDITTNSHPAGATAAAAAASVAAVSMAKTRKPFSRPRVLTRLQEKINSLECDIQNLPQDSHIWRGNETHELLLPITIPENCITAQDCLPMIISWEGQAEIQSGDVLLVEINDALLTPAEINEDSRNKARNPQIISLRRSTSNSVHFLNTHKAATRVYQVTRPGHEHCDVTEGVLLDITPLVVDGKKLVTLYDKDLTEGINLLIVVSDLWGSQCVRLKVTVKSDNCGENADCSGKGVCFSNISMEGYECQCCSGFAGPHCEEIDACSPSPCTNNGICVDLSQGHEGNAYQCLCPYGYTGKNCQYESDPCNPAECMNGGSCVGNSTHFRCDCAPGYTGPLCQHNLNECESSPCVHGICVDQEDGFRCFCQPGFAGELCNFEYNECESNPCLNGGECIDQIGSFECKCTKGYTGNQCHIKVDFCANGPCPEGHRCTDHGDDFTCECPGGRNGPDCNQVPRTLCNVNPCANGGTCWTSEDSFYCACRPGYTGKMCEDEFVVETVVSSSEFMVDDANAGNAFSEKSFGSAVSKSPIELHNAYIAAGTLAAAIFIVAVVVTICHCKVHQTYRKFSTRHHQLIPIFGFGKRIKSPKSNRHWLSGKGGGGGGGGGGGSIGSGGGNVIGTKANKGHLPGTGVNQCHNHHIGGSTLHHQQQQQQHQQPHQVHDRPFQRHLAMNLENDMYYTVDFSDSQHSPLIQ